VEEEMTERRRKLFW